MDKIDIGISNKDRKTIAEPALYLWFRSDDDV